VIEKTIGSALTERRNELGLEKGQAADRIGMSRTTYSSYEQDAQRPSVDVFPALATFLQVSIEELLAFYGATCVVAVRPALKRLLSGPESLPDVSVDPDVPVSDWIEGTTESDQVLRSENTGTTSTQSQLEATPEMEIVFSSEPDDTSKVDSIGGHGADEVLGTPSSPPQYVDSRFRSEEFDGNDRDVIGVNSLVFSNSRDDVKSERKGKHFAQDSSHKKKKKKKQKRGK